MRRILVTGAATWTGGRLIQELGSMPDAAIFAVDDREPDTDLPGTFEKIDLDRLDLARYLLDVAPHVVVHLQTVDRSAHLGGTRTYEENVVGAQALFGAIGRCVETRHVIVKSDAAVYGASPRNASVLSVGAEPQGRGRFQRNLAEMERFVRETAQQHSHVDYTILRFAPIFGPAIGNVFSRYLALPTVPSLLGFDPRLQVLNEEDAVGALLHCIERPAVGTFNVAARGQLYLSRIVRLGKRIPQPLPKRPFEAALRGLSRLDLRIPEHLVALLKHGRVMDLSNGAAFGFEPRFTCRQAVLAGYGMLPTTEEGRS